MLAAWRESNEASGALVKVRRAIGERFPHGLPACGAAFSFRDKENAHVLRSILRGRHRATCVCLLRSSSHRASVS